MNKRTLVILSIALTFVVLIASGFIYWTYRRWYSEQILENLKGYVAVLEEYDGYTVEERPLTDFHVDYEMEWHWFSDFRSYARQVNATDIYVDHGRNLLFFISEPLGGGIEAEIFYYNKLD